MNVIRIVGLASGARCAAAGHYLKAFDPDAYEGRGWADFTRTKEKALRFDSPAAAMKTWKRQSTVQPLRSDGNPNRPLTAFTIEILPAGNR